MDANTPQESISPNANLVAQDPESPPVTNLPLSNAEGSPVTNPPAETVDLSCKSTEISSTSQATDTCSIVHPSTVTPDTTNLTAQVPISRAQDAIQPSSQCAIEDTAMNIPAVDSFNPVVIQHPYLDATDSGSSAPSSPTPGKLRKKKKNKRKHLKAGQDKPQLMTSPLTNQITASSTNFPSMSQLVQEISAVEKRSSDPSALGRLNTAQVDTEMMQIDSILKALNTGTFDVGNMATIQQLTEERPQNVLSSVHQKSPGLALISQLGSESDESSSSDSEMSTSDEEEEVPAITEETEGQEEDDTKSRSYPMVKGEINYHDLPPVEVPEEEFPVSATVTAIGTAIHTTEKLSS